ncbi:MAG: cytochrome c [Planctomycetaceae bacterium]
MICNSVGVTVFAVLAIISRAVPAGERPGAKPATAAQRGYHKLRTKAFLPPDFDQAVFDDLWKRWPEPLRGLAAKATPRERRRMAFDRYGLIEPPGSKGTGPALGYVDDRKGGWVMNCFTCHAGKVAGRTILGLPNTHLDLQSLIEDVRATKLRMGKPLGHLDLGSLKIPLNTTAGTTNSVVFGIALGALRDKDMNFVLRLKRPKYTHHDVDAPPWWHVRRKTKLYCDAFAPKNHRVLMQFILIPKNDRKTLLSWEQDFAEILAWMETLEPPKYPWTIDAALAAKGKTAFKAHCSRCHGTYGPGGRYPQKVVPLKAVGTDPLRLRALTPAHRLRIKQSWMSRYGKDPVDLDPAGYLAPPLDGIWASAPYFHNGSTPTLWHVLHPGKRPVVWKRKTADGYDRSKLGPDVVTFRAVPETVTDRVQRRRYFDTRKPGKSAAGHRFPEVLTEDEKRAVLEYLKTL